MAAASADRGSAPAPDRELVATREFDAPRERVWEVWTDPEHIARWWGPRGFTNTIEEMDVRPGGTWSFVMHGPDGTDYRNEMRYVELVRPERIVMDHVSGPRFRLTATFAERGGKTVVTMRSTFESPEQLARVVKEFHADEGMVQNLERLGEHLAALRSGAAGAAEELVLTRLFDAPRQAVFDAWMRPEAVARWWGPKGFTLPSCEMDFRPGGAYRFVMRGPDGAEYPFHGVYREIAPPSRIVFTAVIEGMGVELLTAVTFEEEGARTRLTVRQTMPPAGPARSGQRQGWGEQLDRLAAFVA